MSEFLPATAEAAVGALLASKLNGVDTQSIGEQDVDEEGQLVFRPPCARTRYAGSMFESTHDNQNLTYNCDHVIEVFCVASNLRSKAAQREDTKALAGQVLEQMAGARLVLSDGTKSEPVRLVDVKGIQQDVAGTVYVVSVSVPGIAQFNGVNA